MFKLVDVIPWIKEIPAAPELECQVAAYYKGRHSDTEFFKDVVDCIKWAIGNVNHFDKFYIYSDNWDYKIVGTVEINNGRREIGWGDKPIDSF